MQVKILKSVTGIPNSDYLKKLLLMKGSTMICNATTLFAFKIQTMIV